MAKSLSMTLTTICTIGLLAVMSCKKSPSKPIESNLPQEPNSVAVVDPYAHLTPEERESLEDIKKSSKAVFCAYVSNDLQTLRDSKRMLMRDYREAGQTVREASIEDFNEGIDYLVKGFTGLGMSRLAEKCSQEACELSSGVCLGD